MHSNKSSPVYLVCFHMTLVSNHSAFVFSKRKGRILSTNIQNFEHQKIFPIWNIEKLRSISKEEIWIYEYFQYAIVHIIVHILVMTNCLANSQDQFLFIYLLLLLLIPGTGGNDNIYWLLYCSLDKL